MVPQYLTQVKFFDSKEDTLEIVVQVANFRHRSGGILESIRLGPASQISKLQIRNIAFEVFLFGSLFIIGIYHVVLYIFRTKSSSALYFGIFALLISARTLLVGEIYFTHIFPSFSWELAHKIQTLSYYVGVALVILFLEVTFTEDISKKITRFIYFFATVFALLVITTPARIFTLFNPIYQAFSFLVIIYILYLVTIACQRKREGAYIIGAGITTLVFFSINDIFFLSTFFADSNNQYLKGLITKGNLSSIGLLVFVFMQSLVLAKKFSKSFTKVELLTAKLQQSNANLEEKVRERTIELENSKEELKQAYISVFRSEKSLQSLTQNISHDLRTPLSSIKGYINAMLDGIIKPAEQEKYLKKVDERVNYLNNMVQELLELSQLQACQLKLDLKPVPVKLLIKTLSDKYSFDMTNPNVAFKINYPTDWQSNSYENLFVNLDMEKLERVLSNLLSNAIKYTSDGDYIELAFNLTEGQKDLMITVSDTGIGIDSENLPFIFDRSYMVSRARNTNNSSGLGLAIVKELVEHHGGRVWAESELGKGSRFCLALPIHY